MNTTIEEFEILLKLNTMKQNKRYIALSLHPPLGDTTIREQGNRLFINEGRDGKWNNIDESFYDNIVPYFDSRSQSVYTTSEA